MNMRPHCSQKGSILILVLWSLTLLSVLAVHLGLTVQRRIELLSRLEKRSQLQDIAEAGADKAIAAVRTDAKRTAQQTPQSKQFKFNNPSFFQEKSLGGGRFDVNHWEYDDDVYHYAVVYGMVDEERKVNINTAGRDVIERLIRHILSDEERAKELSSAIFDWREHGESEITGFFSDDFYGQLQYPYEAKKTNYETLDELMLVKGMNPQVYRWLTDFVTIYGDGRVNINTAPKAVLVALGFSEELAQKILIVRRGADGREATADDIVFQTTESLGLVLAQTVGLEPQEIEQVNALNARHALTTESRYYKVRSAAQLNNSDEKTVIVCVFDLINGKIKYWREM